MAERTALLIRCSVEEAARIHERAAEEHRTVAGYMLHILERMIAVDETLARTTPGLVRFGLKASQSPPQPRTALLLRCSMDEAKRIRLAAERRGASVSGFVVHCLQTSWRVALGGGRKAYSRRGNSVSS